jgi:hypothetical protein
MLGSPIYDGHIRVIYIDYLLLSCMPVYMLLYVCYMHMIPFLKMRQHLLCEKGVLFEGIRYYSSAKVN